VKALVTFREKFPPQEFLDVKMVYAPQDTRMAYVIEGPGETMFINPEIVAMIVVKEPAK
jgi:hypothetical protein